MGVVVMGVGVTGTFPTSGGLSYREIIARAATMAYRDAGIEPDQIDGAVSVEEDFVSGYSITDEYVPDQLGMVRKPVYTIPGDFLQGLGSAVMQIQTGRFDTIVVESYSKASNVLTKDELLTFAYDPSFNRLGVSPHYLAGIEMAHYLDASETTQGEIASFVARARGRAIGNPLAAYGAKLDSEDVLDSRPVALPVTELMIARPADAAIVVVLGTDAAAKEHRCDPVRISGTGWGSATSIIERRAHAISVGTMIAAKQAYEEAGIDSPASAFDVAYVSDLYAHRAFMHMEALGLGPDAPDKVNPDGGSLGMGDLYEANGGARLVDAVLQLRGAAGRHQVSGAKRAMVQGWRGLPTDTSAVVVLEA